MLYYLEFDNANLVSINSEKSLTTITHELQENISYDYLYNNEKITYKIDIPDNLKKIYLITYTEKCVLMDEYNNDSGYIIFDYTTIKDVVSELITKNHNLNPEEYTDIKSREFCQDCITNGIKSKCYKDALEIVDKYKDFSYINIDILFDVIDNGYTIIGNINIKSISL